MKFTFETVHGRSFTLDCDEGERLQGIVTRAALDKGYNPKEAQLSLRGRCLDLNSTLEENSVDWKRDVMVLHGTKQGKKRAADEDDEEELKAAEQIRIEERDNVISLEAVKKDLAAQQVALQKPTFLSKKQREELALKKREEAARVQAEKRRKVQERRQQLFEEADAAGRELERSGERKATGAQKKQEEPKTEEEKLQQKIKAKYLGEKKVKKVVKKQNERLTGKDLFEWDLKDDTSQDPFYSEAAEPQLLFGRGFRAGIDARAQVESKLPYEEAIEARETEKQMEELTKETERKKRRELVKEMKKQHKSK